MRKIWRNLIGRHLLRNWWHYLLAIVLVVAVTVIGHMAKSFLTITNMAMLYLICVVVTSVLWGLGPAILTCILAVLAHDFFFISPFFSLGPPDIHDIPTLIILLLVSVIISYLTSLVQRQTSEALRREQESATLYSLSRSLSFTNELESTTRVIIQSARETFDCEIVLFLPDMKYKEPLIPYMDQQSLHIDKNDYAAAYLAFKQGRPVGQGMATLSDARARYLPLNSARGVIGVLALYPGQNSNLLTGRQSTLLDVFADLAAVSIERALLAIDVRESQILEEKEKLQTALFSSISHDLRTPLASVMGVLGSLREEGISMNDDVKKKLIQVASEEAERLNRLIANLLDSSRIQADSIKLYRQPSDVKEILNAALEELPTSANAHPIQVNIPPELPLISLDFGLMVHVFVNILDNAFKYSEVGLPVEVNARELENEIEIEVADRGIGIPEQELVHVFDRFYRVKRPEKVTGTGLGLSICKGIVESHNGRISAEIRPGGGTKIRLTLPIEDVTVGSWPCRR
jgi:two-component system sensor histidine kinase KdpD